MNGLQMRCVYDVSILCVVWGGGGGVGGCFFFFFKQKTAYEIGTGDWSSDVCSSDLTERVQKLLDSSHRCAKLADAWNPAFEPQARGSFRADAGDLLFELKDAWSDAIADRKSVV